MSTQAQLDSVRHDLEDVARRVDKLWHSAPPQDDGIPYQLVQASHAVHRAIVALETDDLGCAGRGRPWWRRARRGDASQIVGLGFVRYILRFELIASATLDQLVAAIAPTLQRYLTGDLCHGA